MFLCLLTCFSGGVFLATCFLHLFPELQENITNLRENYGFDVDYPLAELLSCLGFFLLFFLEEVVIMLIPSMAHGHSHGGHGHQEHAPLNPEVKESGCCMTGVVIQSPTNETQFSTKTKKIIEPEEHFDCQMEPIFSDEGEQDDTEVSGHCQKHCPLTVHQRRSSGRETPECPVSNEVAFTAVAFAEPERCETNCEKVDEDPPILMKSSPHAHSHGVRSITLVLALSIHSVIEGIALGVGDSAPETTALFLSLMVHKLIVAFSVGLQLARTHAHQLRWVVMSMVTLSLMSPLGALIGMGVQSIASDSLVKEATITVLQGLAVGTFLYVTFFEVLLHERDNEHPNLLKLLVMLIGFGLIGLLRLADRHEHGHGHSHVVGGAGHEHDGHDHDGLVNATARALLGH